MAPIETANERIDQYLQCRNNRRRVTYRLWTSMNDGVDWLPQSWIRLHKLHFSLDRSIFVARLNDTRTNDRVQRQRAILQQGQHEELVHCAEHRAVAETRSDFQHAVRWNEQRLIVGPVSRSESILRQCLFKHSHDATIKSKWNLKVLNRAGKTRAWYLEQI